MDIEQKIVVQATKPTAVRASSAEGQARLAKLVSAGGKEKPRVEKPQPTVAGRAMRSITTAARGEMQQVVRVVESMVAPSLKMFATVLRFTFTTIRTGVGLVIDIIEATGGVVRFAGPVGIALGALGTYAVARYVLLPLANLMIGMKLLHSSFDWAREQSEAAMKIAALAKYRFSGVIASEFEKGERQIDGELRGLKILAGDQAEEITRATLQRFSRQAFQRGTPDQQIYNRWGITAERIEALTAVGQDKPLDFLDRFISWREVLERNERKFAEGTVEHELAKRWFDILHDDVAKMFGQEFAELVMRLKHEDVEKVRRHGKDAEALGFVEDADKKAIDFNISLQSLRATFGAITEGIGGDLQPQMARTFDGLRKRLVEPDAKGRVLGTQLRELGAAVIGKAWDVTIELIKDIDLTSLRDLLKSFASSVDRDTVHETISAIKWLTEKLAGWFGVDLSKIRAESEAKFTPVAARAAAAGGSGGGRGGGGGAAPGAQAGVGTGPVQLSGNVGAESAVDEMMTMRGMHERDPVARQKLIQYLKSGGHGMDPAWVPWCAAFVNSALQRAGIKGTHSNLAWSFSRFGTPVRPGEVAKGDVLVTSHHVGLATGRTRDGMMEMISGNTSDRVGITWVRPGQYLIRRPPAAQKQSAADAAYKVAARNSFEREIAMAKMLSDTDRRKVREAIAESMAA